MAVHVLGMGKVLQRRVIAAALTLAGAAIVFVLFVPIASGGNPGGKDQITGYGNQKGQVTKKVHAGMPFYVFGKNLNHVLSAPDAVWCWDGTDNEWLPIEWEYGPNSKTLLVGVDPDCIGSNSAIGAYFDDGRFVVGPRVAIV